MTETWRNRAPAMLLSEGGPDGEHLSTPMDRRWLWRIEMFLAVSGTNETQHQMARDLRQYLNETCAHAWRSYDGDEDIPAHRQCLWCCDVEWAADQTPATHDADRTARPEEER